VLTDSLGRKEAWRPTRLFFVCIFPMNFAMATLGLKEMGKFLWEGREKSLPSSRHSGYSFVLTCYSWSLALCLGDRDNIKTDLNQMNDNLNEKSIQNALAQLAVSV
jgi:hypothetical protein